MCNSYTLIQYVFCLLPPTSLFAPMGKEQCTFPTYFLLYITHWFSTIG